MLHHMAELRRSARDSWDVWLWSYANTPIMSIAKATDENLTSENWEYILVRVAEFAGFALFTIEGALRA